MQTSFVVNANGQPTDLRANLSQLTFPHSADDLNEDLAQKGKEPFSLSTTF
jgi:hypothetical protein